VEGRAIPFAADASGTLERPRLTLTVGDPEHAKQVECALRGSFMTAPREFAVLIRKDPVIGALNARFPGLRPVRQLDLLTALVRSVSAQQVNLRWAATTRRRLAERFGTRHEIAGEMVYSFEAARLAGASVEGIRELQFTTRKAEYIIGIAEEIASGRLSMTELEALPDDDVVSRLSALRGIGRWTAEWILVRTLGRPAVVAGDLGVRKAVGQAYGLGAMPSEAEVRAKTAHWGTSAAIAQALVLHALVQEMTKGVSMLPRPSV
jgi:DNA-3-methyladenine glycosylase II